jgi:hypothetical protein
MMAPSKKSATNVKLNRPLPFLHRAANFRTEIHLGCRRTFMSGTQKERQEDHVGGESLRRVVLDFFSFRLGPSYMTLLKVVSTVTKHHKMQQT